MRDQSLTTAAEGSQPKSPSRLVETRARLSEKLFHWAEHNLRWLWRRLGSYCNCRRRLLSQEGIRESYVVRLGRTPTHYEVARADWAAAKGADRWVVTRGGATRIPYAGALVPFVDALCSCGGWIPRNVRPSDLESSGDTLRWTDRGMRRMSMAHTYYSVSSAERRIDQIVSRESRIRSWLRWGLDLVLVGVTLFAVLGTNSTPESGPPADPGAPPRHSVQTDAPAP